MAGTMYILCTKLPYYLRVSYPVYANNIYGEQEFLYTIKGIAINVRHIEYVDLTNRFVKMRGLETLISIGERMKEQFLTELYKYGDVEKR